MKFGVNPRRSHGEQWARQYSLAHWCLNEPCELPSEFMFWLFREESRDSKKVTFRLPRAPEGKKKVTLTRRASL
jgi:hypothetical protein